MTVDMLNEGRAEGVARAFAGKTIAFVPVMHDHESPDGKTRAALGVAVANENGFCPIPQFYFAADKYDDAETKADALNRDTLKIDAETAVRIQISTMGGQRFIPEGVTA